MKTANQAHFTSCEGTDQVVSLHTQCLYRLSSNRFPAPWLSPLKMLGAGEGRWLRLKRALHQSIPLSHFPSLFPYLGSSTNSPDKIHSCVDTTAYSLWLGEIQTFYFATGRSEFGLPDFTWKQALRSQDSFLLLFTASGAKNCKALPRQ